MTDNEEKLRATASKMVAELATKIEKLVTDYPDKNHVMRQNRIGYEDQAVDFIVEMAKTYHTKEPSRGIS